MIKKNEGKDDENRKKNAKKIIIEDVK